MKLTKRYESNEYKITDENKLMFDFIKSMELHKHYFLFREAMINESKNKNENK